MFAFVPWIIQYQTKCHDHIYFKWNHFHFPLKQIPIFNLLIFLSIICEVDICKLVVQCSTYNFTLLKLVLIQRIICDDDFWCKISCRPNFCLPIMMLWIFCNYVNNIFFPNHFMTNFYLQCLFITISCYDSFAHVFNMSQHFLVFVFIQIVLTIYEIIIQSNLSWGYFS
jgi:hypothetical protein